MLRLLILLSAATAQTAPPTAEESKQRVESARLAESLKAYKEATGTYPPPRITLWEAPGYDPLWKGNPQPVWYGLNPASDLSLVKPDDSLRAQLKLPDDRGLVATSVRDHGPAWLAGVRENDILMTLDGSPLTKPEDLDAKLKQAGEKHLILEVIRNGAPVKLNVQPRVRATLGPVDAEETTYVIGVSVAPPAPALRAQLNLPDRQGLVVMGVADDSPAARSDLKVNDVILGVAGQPLTEQASLSEIVQKNGDKPLAVEFIREGARRTVHVIPDKGRAVRLIRPFITFGGGPRVSTVVRPGVVENRLEAGQLRIDLPTAPDASAKRLDEMAADIKALRQAIEGLRKALEERK